MTYATWRDYRSPLDQENRDRRARFWRGARRAERGQRFMLRWRLPFIFIIAVLGAMALACDDTTNVYAPKCEAHENTRHDGWDWARIAFPAGLDVVHPFSLREIGLLERTEANGVSDADASEFAARMSAEFAELWRWYVTLTPSERQDVLQYIRIQNALNGWGPAYSWPYSDGSGNWYMATTDGIGSFTGLR